MKPGIKLLLKLRWILLILGMLCLGRGLIFFWLSTEQQNGSHSIGMLMLGIFFFSQWLFLRPGRHCLFKLANDPRPMKLSIALLAVVMTFTTAGMAFVLFEVFSIEEGIEAFFASMGIGFFWFTLALSWGLWAVFFYWRWRVCSVNRYTALARILRTCFAGTLLELITGLCAYATIKDPDNCNCARGSYIGFCLGSTAMLWLFGPGIALVFLYERQKRLYRRTICIQCKYELRGSVNNVPPICPECGTPFDPQEINRCMQVQINSAHGIGNTTPRDH